jgi:N-acetylmuramoyl-L-alanine amidase
MEQSVELARCIQNQYTAHAGRQNKGVKQAGFLVLRETSMPSVLTELGFISTPAEEEFLRSASGQRQLAQSIYNGFVTYYKKVTKRVVAPLIAQEAATPPPAEESGPETPAVEKPSQQRTATVAMKEAPVYKVQIFVNPTKLKATDTRLKNLEKPDCYKDGGVYKYTSGCSTNFNEINNLRRELSKRFKGCFVVAFLNGKRIDLNKARQMGK